MCGVRGCGCLAFGECVGVFTDRIRGLNAWHWCRVPSAVVEGREEVKDRTMGCSAVRFQDRRFRVWGFQNVLGLRAFAVSRLSS